MLDKTVSVSDGLAQLDPETLIAAALECAEQQALLLAGDTALEDDAIAKLQELERARSAILHAIDWGGIQDVAPYQASLQALQSLDRRNQARLNERHSELAARVKLLKKRRSAVGEYLNFR